MLPALCMSGNSSEEDYPKDMGAPPQRILGDSFHGYGKNLESFLIFLRREGMLRHNTGGAINARLRRNQGKIVMAMSRVHSAFSRWFRMEAILSPANDATLLSAFIELRDAQAFESLVRRHGPMVPSVCRDEVSWRDLTAVIDEEMTCLPHHYRTVIVMCEWQGSVPCRCCS